jgi:5-formyltetrahydrofolate cyclo-ligase
MGILAPAPHTEYVEPEEIDLLVVPGVAFTRDGKRMGYGGGYYDRFIPLCTNARIMALAFREQLVDTLPTEEHDLPIPELITPLT